MSTVTFEHVTKKYGDVLAVNDLNLAINEGEFMVLVGPSGCGKTTSLRMIAGLEEISSGELKIGDRIVNDVPPKVFLLDVWQEIRQTSSDVVGGVLKCGSRKC